MTDSSASTPRARSLAEIADVRPFAVLAVIGAVVGIWWFPAWFLSAQLVRIWATRGGMRWLAARGVTEYTDDKIVKIVGLVPVAIIAVRIIVAVNWLQPVQVLESHQLISSGSELSLYLDAVVGVAMAAALTGVLTTRGLPWLLALLGFGVVATMAVTASRGVLWQPNAFEAIPVALLGGATSWVATFWNNRNDGPPHGGSDQDLGSRQNDLRWTNVSRTKR